MDARRTTDTNCARPRACDQEKHHVLNELQNRPDGLRARRARRVFRHLWCASGDIGRRRTGRTDDANADDPTYVSCIYDSSGKRVTVILRAGNDMVQRDKQNGLTPVSGYGDQAFYSGEKGGQLRWVDVVRGGDSCEALLGVEQTDLGDGDFSKTGGEICVAALAAR